MSLFEYKYTFDSNILKNYENIKNHISALIRIEKNNNETVYVNILLVKLVSELITKGYSPYTFFSDEFILNKLISIRLDDIINKALEWIYKNKLCNCNILQLCSNLLDINHDKNIIYEIVKQHIVDYGIVPKCKYLLLSYQYYLQEKRVGNIQEITDYETLLLELETNPEEFHQKYKYKIPTQNLDKLIPKIMDTNLFKIKEPCCGICQYDIEPLQCYYELPCKHVFHENDENCLKSATIISWLKNNKLCPICKQEVVL